MENNSSEHKLKLELYTKTLDILLAAERVANRHDFSLMELDAYSALVYDTQYLKQYYSKKYIDSIGGPHDKD